MSKQIEEQLAILRQEIDFLARELRAQAHDFGCLVHVLERPSERARFVARVLPHWMFRKDRG